MDTIRIERNKSATYFLPLFAEELPINHFNLLENTYLWYDSFKEDIFCLLYRYDGRVKGTHMHRSGFSVYENNILTKNHLFAGYQDYGRHVIYKYELTDDLIDYRDLLLQGKYSKLPDEAKKRILNFTKKNYGINERNYVEKVLTRNEVLRMELAERLGYKYLPEETELSSIIDLDKELFSKSIIK